MTGFLNFSQRVASIVDSVDLLQYQHGQAEIIGTFDARLDQLFLSESK